MTAEGASTVLACQAHRGNHVLDLVAQPAVRGVRDDHLAGVQGVERAPGGAGDGERGYRSHQQRCPKGSHPSQRGHRARPHRAGRRERFARVTRLAGAVAARVGPCPRQAKRISGN
jgi:hypothetical protein